MATITEHNFTVDGKKTSYLVGGPVDGPLLIFVHGWPFNAETWKPQLIPFAALGFLVVAPDTRGYGNSYNPQDRRAYRLEELVSDQLSLLHHLNRTEAIWIGHDWGCGIVWALVAHHPEVCVAVANLCVPYRTLEFGLPALLPYVNREIYPEAEYPHGQWDYQVFYETSGDKASKTLGANNSRTMKALLRSIVADPGSLYKPARTATITKDGGWFGGLPEAPDVPFDSSVPGAEFEPKLSADLDRNGWFGPTAYYLNHDVNREYSAKVVNDGYLDVPVLFIEAKFDTVCATATSRISEPMRRYCRDLTETSIDGGHQVGLEKPEEVNAALARWIATKVSTSWPGYWRDPFVSNSKI